MAMTFKNIKHKKVAIAAVATTVLLVPAFFVFKNIQQGFAAPGTTYLGGVHTEGDVLRLAITNDGGVNLQRYVPEGNCALTPGSTGSCWTRQFFAENGSGLIFYANDEVMFWGGNNDANFEEKSANVNISVGNSVMTAGTESITRTWTGTGPASGIVLNEVISLPQGSLQYSRMVEVVNNTGAALNDVRLIVGGDTQYAGQDNGYASLHTWYGGTAVDTYSSTAPGRMIFAGAANTPADRYFGGHFNLGRIYAQQSAWLPNEVSGSSESLDTGYYLQWGNGSRNIATNGTWTVGMNEALMNTASSQIEVTPPASAQSIPRGEAADISFTVTNVSGELLNLSSISAVSQAGHTASVSSTSATLIHGQPVEIVVSVTVPTSAIAGTTDKITLSVPFAGLTSGTESADANLSVINPAATIVSVSPAVGLATGGDEITITGTNFVEGATVTLGGNAATITSLTATAITVTAPAHAAGLVDLVLSVPYAEAVTVEDAYEYVSADWVDGNSHTIGDSSTLVFNVSRNSTLVDTAMVGSTDVTASVFSTNGTTVTLSAALLNGLTAGSYTLKVVYSDGFEASGTFMINLAPLAIEITGITNGATMSPSLNTKVTATATHHDGIANIDIYLDNVLVARCINPKDNTCDMFLKGSNTALGSHILRAEASAKGTSGASDSVSITFTR